MSTTKRRANGAPERRPLYAVPVRSVVSISAHGDERFLFRRWRGGPLTGTAHLEHLPNADSPDDYGAIRVPLDQMVVVHYRHPL